MDEASQRIEPVRAKVTVAAEAIWRITEPEWFDVTLRDELRRNAARAISAVGALSIGSASPERLGVDTLLATLVAIEDLLQFARGLSLVSDENVALILRGYHEIRELAHVVLAPSNTSPEIISSFPPEQERITSASMTLPANSRQERIIAFIRANGQAQISELARLFGEEVSEKTLQRDLLHLVNTGILGRKGDNRWTVYFPSGIGQEEMPEIAQ